MPLQSELQRRIEEYEAALDRLVADLEKAGLPLSAIDRAKAHFVVVKAEMRAAAGLPLPGKE